MTITNKLELLAMSSKFTVKSDDYECYEVAFADDSDDYPLSAMYNAGGWTYYINGVYNNDCDYVRVDICKLAELKRFCEALGDSDDR